MVEERTETAAHGSGVPILDPNPQRRRRLVEILQKFFDDKISMAEMRGFSKENLLTLAETGYVKFKHGRITEAEKIYQSLIVLDHRNGYFHSVMGAIHQKQSRPVDAILEFARALECNENDVCSYVNRGEIYLRHKNFRKAAEDFRQAIVLDPTGRHLWANRARSLVIALKRQVDAQRTDIDTKTHQ
jgi:tetratricopeptide (TPR) repeat protein